MRVHTVVLGAEAVNYTRCSSPDGGGRKKRSCVAVYRQGSSETYLACHMYVSVYVQLNLRVDQERNIAV
jgi:hypothetical protein